MEKNKALRKLESGIEKYAHTIKYTVTGPSDSGLVAHFYSIDMSEFSAVIRSFINKNREKPAKYGLRIKDNFSGEQFEFDGSTARDVYNKICSMYQKYIKIAGTRKKTQGTRISAPDPMSYVTKQLLAKTKC